MRPIGQKPILRSIIASLLFAFLTASIATVIGGAIGSPHINTDSLAISGAMLFACWLVFAPRTGLRMLWRNRKTKAAKEADEGF